MRRRTCSRSWSAAHQMTLTRGRTMPALPSADLRAIGARRRDQAQELGFTPALTCSLKLTENIIENLLIDFDVGSREEVAARVLEDLAGEVAFLPLGQPTFKDGSSTEGHFHLIGCEFRLHVQLPADTPARLLVHRVRPEAGSFLDRDRDRGWRGAVRFQIEAPTDAQAAAGALSELLTEVLNFVADKDRAEKQQGRRRVLEVWRRALQALADVERGREKPLSTRKIARGAVQWSSCLRRRRPEIVGQQRMADLADGSLLAGEVAQVSGKELLLRVERGDPTVPRRQVAR